MRATPFVRIQNTILPRSHVRRLCLPDPRPHKTFGGRLASASTTLNNPASSPRSTKLFDVGRAHSNQRIISVWHTSDMRSCHCSSMAPGRKVRGRAGAPDNYGDMSPFHSCILLHTTVSTPPSPPLSAFNTLLCSLSQTCSTYSITDQLRR